MKQHKPWFDEVCLGILDQRKQAKMQWMQNPSHSNVDNMNNVRREASRHFRNKKAYLKAKIEELETNSKINNTCIGALITSRRGISLELLL
jgi:archaellum biogenesis ATPase FlaH